MNTTSKCPCASDLPFSNCCGPVLEGTPAASPVALMRARYSAYATQNIVFLRDSLAPGERKDFDEKSVEEWSRQSQWLGMEIRRTEKGEENDQTGLVEFIARFKQDGVTREHHELAEFIRQEERWYFKDGRPVRPAPLRHTEPRVGRNDPCQCGSGKKNKKCCGTAT